MDIDKISNYSAYIILIVSIIGLLIIIALLRANKEPNTEYFSADFSELCGPGTKPGDDTCVPDEDFIGQELINSNLIQYIKGDIVFTPGYEEDVVIESPDWYITWLDQGSYNCQKLIHKGICNIPGNNCNAPCRCGDCAGWRGGNKTDCDSKDIGTGRVWCNLVPGEAFTFSGEPDKCECAYGYCAVNGLCVSPFKIDDDDENTRCCPSCSWYSPDDGGCAGSVKCDTNKICQDNIVELPGKKYNLRESNKIKTINNLCTSENQEDCYDPNHTDARRKQPYIIVEPDSNNDNTKFDFLVNEDTETAAGQNEYDCAFKCGDNVSSQVECSKRCLPKLWKWYPVFEKMEDTGGMRYTGGFHQSDELMRYLPSNTELRFCPENTCETELNVPDIAQFNNCTDCEDCLFSYDTITNNNGFKDRKYICKKCDKCILDQISENGQNYQVTCKNMTNCNTCVNVTQDLNGIEGIVFNECDACNGPDPNDPESGCKVYTLDPYVTKENVEFHPQSIMYNHGADPGKNYQSNSVTQGYNPDSRPSVCDEFIFDGNETCDNTLDGKIGWGDGFFFSIGDCTENCT